MRYLKADTAVTVRIGPAISISDGYTLLSTLAINTADYAYASDAGGTETDISANTWAAVTSVTGWYDLTLTAGQLGVEGPFSVMIGDVSLCLPVYNHFHVVNANVYDSLFAAAATDYLQVDTLQLAGTTQDATDLADFAAAGYDPATNKVQGVVLTDTVTTLTGHTAQTGDSFARIGATGSGLTSLAQASVATETRLSELDAATAGKMANQVDIIQTDTTTDIPALIATAQADLDIITDTDGVVIGAAGVDLIWDETYTGHTTNQTFGKILKGISEGWISAEGSVNDASATTTSFITDLTSARDNFYNDAVLVFITEAVADTVKGVSRPITSYTASTKTVTFDEAFPVAPANTDQFIILNGHTHPVSEIVAGVVGDAVIAELTTQGDTNETKLDTLTTNVADVPTVAEFETRTPTAAQLAYMTANAATGVPVTFTTAGGSTTAAVLNLVDGASASSTDDQYKSRLLVFNAGTLKEVVTDITAYNGTTKVATITAIPTAPTSSHTARLI